MGRKITYDSQGNDITCMKEFDGLMNPCKVCDMDDCKDRENRKDEENILLNDFLDSSYL